MERPLHTLTVIEIADGIRRRALRATDVVAHHIDRIRRLESVSWPQPEAEFIAATFQIFAEKHPWVGEADLHPKGIAREMFEGCIGFVDQVRELGVGRSEGLLLRYLSQVHDTLVRSVPEEHKTQAVYDAIAYFRTLVQGVDIVRVHDVGAMARVARMVDAMVRPHFSAHI